MFNVFTLMYVMMYWIHHIGITPLPMNNLFIENTTQHAYYTRQINNLQTPIGNNEKVYKLFSFHGINMCHTHATKTYQKDIYKGIPFHIESHKHL